MKTARILFTVMAFCLMATFTQTHAQSVYQLPNPGFEQWDGTATNAEPEHWNSFATADGSWASLASTPHHYHRNGGRPGTEGSSYLTIYSTSVLGIVANGNMTTGRMHVGAMSASSSENYNYTQRSNTSHCQPFNGTPDSMYIWVSFYAAQQTSMAQVTAVIHGDNDFRSPNYENNPAFYCGKAITRFARTTSSSTMTWQQMKVPFEYDGAATPQYMLLSMTTNFNPGSGNANDSLSIDDIEFIYSAWLTNITLNGTTLDNFAMDVFDYSVTLADTAALSSAVVAVQTQVSDATPVITTNRLTDSTAMVTITFTAEDSVTVKEYHITLSAPMPEPVHYTVTVTAGDGGSVNPEGEIVVESDDSITVTATPEEGYHFLGWSIDPGYTSLVTDNPLTLTVTGDLAILAYFEADSTPETPRYTVTVIADEGGSVNPAGVRIVDSASTITVTATPVEGYLFAGWSIEPGYDNIVTDNPLTITVTSDLTVTAHFEADSTHEGIVVPAVSQSVAIYPNPVTDKVTVEAEGSVELVDMGGSVIASWKGSKVVDLSALPAGVYLLRCNGEAHKIVKR